VLDLFAGTGQMGIEALSRGASSCVFVDMRRDAAALVRENLAVCGLSDGAQVVCGDAMGYLSALRTKPDLIFLDPPYADDVLERALVQIAQFDILAPHGIIVAESPEDKRLPALSAPYGIYREYRYGKIKVTVYHRSGEEEA
jgi:16S rRNA (guanine(966)-N(2))-methyltransferase RsmD